MQSWTWACSRSLTTSSCVVPSCAVLSCALSPRAVPLLSSALCETTLRAVLSRALPSRGPLFRSALWRAIFLAFLATVLAVVAAGAANADWQIVPEVRVSGGEESDLVVSPEASGVVVPGGSFVELSPGLSARGRFGLRTLLDLGTFATVQRFVNEESRLVYAHTFLGNVSHDFNGSLRGRISTTLSYFDDSGLETLRRFGVGGEAGVSLVQPRWSAEAWGGAGDRRYPSLTVQDRMRQASDYDEATLSAGGVLRFWPADNIDVRVDGVRQATDSGDPYFDSDSWVLSGSVETRPTSSLELSSYGTYQEREFQNRPQGEDKDEYWQVGLGLRYSLAPGLSASIRWGYSEYTWPDGSVQDSYRFAIGLERAWGRRAVLPLPAIDVDALTRAWNGSVREPDQEGKVCFRVPAAGAEKVTVAGSFNSWDPETTHLHPVGEGWWEACIELAPGLYEYAYLIDGVWTVPPEAKSTVDDGFGGRNGTLEVLPPDV